MDNFQDTERAVTREEGLSLAQEHKCSFLECSAKTKENVQQCFKELTLKVSLQNNKPILMNNSKSRVFKKFIRLIDYSDFLCSAFSN